MLLTGFLFGRHPPCLSLTIFHRGDTDLYWLNYCFRHLHFIIGFVSEYLKIQFRDMPSRGFFLSYHFVNYFVLLCGNEGFICMGLCLFDHVFLG